MIAQMIRPHVNTPTAKAAIHAFCQKASMIGACSVAGAGKPKRPNWVSVEQPDKPMVRAAAAATPTTCLARFERGDGLTDRLPTKRCDYLVLSPKIGRAAPVQSGRVLPRETSAGLAARRVRVGR